jgi:hypothetical protein
MHDGWQLVNHRVKQRWLSERNPVQLILRTPEFAPNHRI